MAPWQPYFIGRQANSAGGPPAWKPFNYTYHFFWGLEDIIAVYTNMWGQLDTNKQVGGSSPTTATAMPGATRSRLPAGPRQARLQAHDPGRYQNLNDDFSAQIAAFKRPRRRSSPA